MCIDKDKKHQDNLNYFYEFQLILMHLLTKLDKKFYADSFEVLKKDLKDLREFMFNKDMYMVRIQADK